ncbi:hypothetical protein ACFO3O_08460 [Dokdonia ponticola]|uniref:Gliding motility-associated protein GldM N-terminal domain-containing protein n=1 Tax=Dokdonia ponticola TaxID=2041041 RepID=A0ABV9HWR4_9FLAO
MKSWGKIVIIGVVVTVAFITIGIYSNREVVNAFEKINEKLETVNSQTQFDNDAIIYTFQNDSIRLKSTSLRATTLVFHGYIENLKGTLLRSAGGNFQKADKETTFFFSNSQITEEGRYFLAAIQKVRVALIKNIAVNDTLLLERVDDLFPSTGVDNQDMSKSWLRHQFDGFPVIAVVAQLTSIQNDVQIIEKQILVNFLDQEKQNTQ